MYVGVRGVIWACLFVRVFSDSMDSAGYVFSVFSHCVPVDVGVIVLSQLVHIFEYANTIAISPNMCKAKIPEQCLSCYM